MSQLTSSICPPKHHCVKHGSCDERDMCTRLSNKEERSLTRCRTCLNRHTEATISITLTDAVLKSRCLSLTCCHSFYPFLRLKHYPKPGKQATSPPPSLQKRSFPTPRISLRRIKKKLWGRDFIISVLAIIVHLCASNCARPQCLSFLSM